MGYKEVKMRMWRTIGSLWILLAWVVVSSSSAYAETKVTVRGSYPSSMERREKSVLPQEEALAARTGTSRIARLARERTSGNGDWIPPLASLLTSVSSAQCQESGTVRLHSFWNIAIPRKIGGGSTGSRAPPFLR
jgi:hypothetical protein